MIFGLKAIKVNPASNPSMPSTIFDALAPPINKKINKKVASKI